MKAGELFDRQSTKKTKAFIAGVNLNDPNFDYYMTELRELFRKQLRCCRPGSQKAENIVAGTYFGVGSNQIKNMAVNYMLKS